jgi:putative transposase
MRTSKFTPEQMVHILRQGESGVPIGELCRQHQISEQTYYRRKKQFGDLGTAEVRELRQLREGNRKLKQLVADLSLVGPVRRSWHTNGTHERPLPRLRRNCVRSSTCETRDCAVVEFGAIADRGEDGAALGTTAFIWAIC